VILFDEPLSNLDAKLREETRKELRQFLGELNITAIYVTHDRVEALALSDTIAVLRAGKIVEMGTPQEIYFDAKDRYVADFIGRANQVAATVLGREGPYTLVETGMGTISCQARDFAEGSRVTLCVRQEFIHITGGSAEPDGNRLEGSVESLEFVGEVYEAEIRVGAEKLLARVDPDVSVKRGDKIRMGLNPSHCMLLSA
jgi:iron(III) transport system ATP-binding protein